MDIGRVCVKLKGKEKGRRCVIVDVIDENFLLVTGPKNLTGVKRRRVNVKHLTFTRDKVSFKRGASDDEVLKTLEGAEIKES